MKKYCPSCGKQSPVSAKFCCHCGNATTLASNVKSATLSEEQEEQEEEAEEITDIQATKLDVEIMKTPSFSETVGGLIQQGPVSSGLETTRGGPTIDEASFMEQFRKEAGPIRGGQSVGEEEKA